jgi:tetratricopeptide (TPR) repeat protein
LEESGDYGSGERWGRAAVDRNPADIWAAHAVAHTMEMQGRQRDGIDWITGLADRWGECNNFAFHVWWHRALFWFELGAFDTVLDLYDREVRADSTEDYLDISNAAALLWRLEQEGVDVGDRWAELAERSAERARDQMLVFADAHYMMAFAAVGDDENEAALLGAERRYASEGMETEADVAGKVGLPLLEAISAHRHGDHGRCVDLLLSVRPALREIGGSHAQRDVFERTLIEAAVGDERLTLARALLSARVRARPNSGLTWRRYANVLSALGDSGPAGQAEAEAARLLQ